MNECLCVRKKEEMFWGFFWIYNQKGLKERGDSAGGIRSPGERNRWEKATCRVGKSNLQAKEEGAPELFQVLGMAEKL